MHVILFINVKVGKFTPGSNIQGIDMLSTEGKAEGRVGECQENDGTVEAGAQVEQAHDENHRRENPCRMIQTVQLGASEHRAKGLPKCSSVLALPYLAWRRVSAR